jgi:hypothetical protein
MGDKAFVFGCYFEPGVLGLGKELWFMASLVLVMALAKGLAATISAVLLGAAVSFLFGVCSQEMEMSFMLLSHDERSILAVLPGEAPPSSCVAVWSFGVSQSIETHVRGVLGVSGRSKQTAMLQSPQRWQR